MSRFKSCKQLAFFVGLSLYILDIQKVKWFPEPFKGKQVAALHPQTKATLDWTLNSFREVFYIQKKKKKYCILLIINFLRIMLFIAPAVVGILIIHLSLQINLFQVFFLTLS
jgi:hypothetical protein